MTRGPSSPESPHGTDTAPTDSPLPSATTAPNGAAGGFIGGVVMAALMGASACGVAYLARDYVTSSPRFSVSEIVVEGGGRRPNDTVERAAGIDRGVNIFSVDLAAARGKLLEDPWVSEATLLRRLPGTIVVRVVEREAAAIVAEEGLFLATSEGEVFKHLESGDPLDFPVVTGISRDAAERDPKWARDTIRAAIALADDYDHSPLALHDSLSEVHVAPGGSMALVVGKSGIRLEVGKPPFHAKLEDAARVVAEAGKRGARLGAVLLDNDVHPDKVVVRLRP